MSDNKFNNPNMIPQQTHPQQQRMMAPNPAMQNQMHAGPNQAPPNQFNQVRLQGKHFRIVSFKI